MVKILVRALIKYDIHNYRKAIKTADELLVLIGSDSKYALITESTKKTRLEAVLRIEELESELANG